jgi:hypothetical protein
MNLNDLTKDELNARLPEPLTASALKKIAKSDLRKMVDALTAPKRTRVLDDRIITTPATDLRHVKAVGQGTKRHALVEALSDPEGASEDALVAATGWSRDVTLSALRYDMGQIGVGVERRGGRYFLLLPQGFKVVPVMENGQSRAAAVAGCRA